jgi:GntR family transcriptional regulator / MocR family aminotransferase
LISDGLADRAKNAYSDWAMTGPAITFDPGLRTPGYRQIANRLREAVAAGTLAPGARLPSTRSLASQLGVARGTVDAAYAVLGGEGIIDARGPAGSIVSPHLAASPLPASRPARRAAEHIPGPLLPLPFRMGLPALDAFPRKLWSRLSVQVARGAGTPELIYPELAGHRPLREAIAAYLGVSRGIACTAKQVMITAGFQGALALVTQALLRNGDTVWVEDPGYPLARQALASANVRTVPVPVDRGGMRIEAGVAAAPHARLAVVTPTHQSPLGVALSLPRRLALLGWAAEAGAWVLEDDYDSEFRYTGRPLPALKSLDRGERVLYAGSFSKVLFPGLRLGYLVVPDDLSDDFLRASHTLLSGQPLPPQRVVAAFMEQGHFARHLRRMRSLYAARRRALAAALTAVFGEGARLELEAGGMHLLVRFPDPVNDVDLTRRAAEAGLAPTPLSSLAVAHDCGQGLLVGFTNVPESEAVGLAQRLAEAV